jgi:phage gp36-like protein
MPLTLYADRDDVERIWSQYGVMARADDDDDLDDEDLNEEENVPFALSKGAADINVYLLQRYTVAVVQTSTWVRWVNALFAAVELARRRGNPVPQPLLDEYNRLLEILKAIASGEMPFVTDTGLAPPEHDNTPFVSNLTVDTRPRRAKIRRVDATSTMQQGDRTRKQFSAFDVPGYFL